jgi:hypothetical protein
MCTKNFHEGIFNWKYVLPKAIWSTPRRHNTILIMGWVFKYDLHDFEGKVEKFIVCFQENSSHKNTYIYVHCKKGILKTMILLN